MLHPVTACCLHCDDVSMQLQASACARKHAPAPQALEGLELQAPGPGPFSAHPRKLLRSRYSAKGTVHVTRALT